MEMGQKKLYEWVERFNRGWTRVVDDAHSGLPSTVPCGEVKGVIDQNI
jgi:hypothetical protein